LFLDNPRPLPSLPIPLLGSDRALLDLSACFRAAYDRSAADDEADYAELPPPPLRPDDPAWAEALLRQHGLRPSQVRFGIRSWKVVLLCFLPYSEDSFPPFDGPQSLPC
jgi:hypothetical protein